MNGWYYRVDLCVCFCVCAWESHRYVQNEHWIHFEKQFHLTHDTKLFSAVITVDIIAPFFSILASNYFSTCNWCLWWFLHFTFAYQYSNVGFLSSIQFPIFAFHTHFRWFLLHIFRVSIRIYIESFDAIEQLHSFHNSSAFLLLSFTRQFFKSIKRKINIQFEKLDGHCPANDIYSASESQYIYKCFFFSSKFAIARFDTIQYRISKCNRVKTFSTN